MRLDNAKIQWQVNWVLKDEKDFNKDLRTEGPAGAKISRHTSEGCILKLIRTQIVWHYGERSKARMIICDWLFKNL